MHTHTTYTTAKSKFAVRMLAGLLVTTAILSPALVHAQSVWTGAEGDDYNDGRNWVGGVPPLPTEEVTINETTSGRQPVLSGASTAVTVQTMSVGRVNRGSLTVQGGAAITIAGDITIGGVSSNAGSQIRAARFGNGTLTITGASSRVNTSSLTMGRGTQDSASAGAEGGAVGLIEVLDGGTLRVSNGLLLGASINGANAAFNGRGVLRVSGAGSTLEYGASNSAEVRNAGSLLEILDGAQVVAIGAANLSITRDGGLRISGTGSDADFGNSLSTSTRTAGLSNAGILVENNAILRVNDLSTSVNPNSSAFGSVGSVLVRSGGQVVANVINIRSGSLITVDGGTLSATGSINVGSSSGISNNQLFLRNGASVNARSLFTGVVGSEIFFGNSEADGPSAMGSYDVGSLTVSTGTRVVFNHNGNPLTINSSILGGGRFSHLAGTTIITGSGGNFTGETILSGGTLLVNGSFGSSTHVMTVSGGSTLGGSGRILGNVTIGNATLAVGNSPGNLTFTGNLGLSVDSILAFELGEPSGVAGVASDLITVSGNLTLDGTLNVANAGGFGAGLYRLINYGGTLTDNGLLIGIAPEGFSPADLSVQTSALAQVNLLVDAPVNSFNFWDGSNTVANDVIDGGVGTWTATGSNWTIMDGSRNGTYDPATLLIFAGAGAAVTVDSTAGVVFLGTGVQFAANGYRVTGGALQFDAASTAFRIGDGTAAGAEITTTIDSVLSGTGSLDKTDLGTLVLTAANTYSGGTTVTDGVLRGTTVSVSGPVAVGSAGTLQFDQATDGTYAGVLTGNGTVRKTGAGALSITGTSDTFVGTTRLEAGTLATSGTLGGNMVVQSTAMLVGNGRVGALDVSGRVSPTGVGTLNVTGDVIFRSGSTFAVDLQAAGGADRIAAGGRATLDGGTVAVTTLDPQTSYTDGSVFRILDAIGGRTGTFAGLTEQSEFLDFVLGYDATGASITVQQVLAFPDVAATYNQRQAADALMNLVRPAGSDALAVYNSLLMLDGDSARAAFNASSGEIYASLLSANQRQGMALAAQFIQRGQAGLEEGLGIWGGVTGRNSHVGGDGNGARFSSDAFGGEIGVDYRGQGNSWAAGIGGGWLSGDVRVKARGSDASTDEWHVGGYVRYGTGAAGVTATASLVHTSARADVTRTISFGPIARTPQAESKFNTTALTVNLRYGFGEGDWTFGPTIGTETSKTQLGAFRETGANVLDLFSSRNSDAWTRLGAGGFVRMVSPTGYFDMSAQYVTGGRNDVDVDLGMAGSASAFNVRAPIGARTGVALQASGSYDLGGNWSLAGQVGATGGNGDATVNGNLRLSLEF
ncbi:autotransporter domain-containing protein [Allopontixanthobacter sediminis]|uniref:Autotransporter domain-containing protein n=1 Tax=Allopontixanthobacter sediminis TaxID=1689985 RepID=A0A845B304_9SPHN|nr:autotransporter domain-containing protein [Allopontixanthobacter sediminis]MXP44985.1 autotransporter domain-containing protein [Allopontixanthobacter sediminis]